MRQENDNHLLGKAAVVTGCSSGIGRQCALALAGRGFLVFATVRKDEDAENLRRLGLDNIVPICPLDLSKPEQIAGAAAAIEAELGRRGVGGLFALVNNAGSGGPAPIELIDPGKFKIEIEARILGSTLLIQALLPAIRRAGGRIVWIMTPGLMPTPYVASIHACDFAVNGLARTLDIELKPWGIRNVMIRCGGIRTPAGMRTTSDVDALLREAPPDRAALYEAALRKWSGEMAKFDRKRTDPVRVAEVVVKALSARRPRRRYAVGHMARAAHILEILPQSAADWILRKRF